MEEEISIQEDAPILPILPVLPILPILPILPVLPIQRNITRANRTIYSLRKFPRRSYNKYNKYKSLRTFLKRCKLFLFCRYPYGIPSLHHTETCIHEHFNNFQAGSSLRHIVRYRQPLSWPPSSPTPQWPVHAPHRRRQ